MKENAKLQEEKNELTVKTRVVNAKLLRLRVEGTIYSLRLLCSLSHRPLGEKNAEWLSVRSPSRKEASL